MNRIRPWRLRKNKDWPAVLSSIWFFPSTRKRAFCGSCYAVLKWQCAVSVMGRAKGHSYALQEHCRAYAVARHCCSSERIFLLPVIQCKVQYVQQIRYCWPLRGVDSHWCLSGVHRASLLERLRWLSPQYGQEQIKGRDAREWQALRQQSLACTSRKGRSIRGGLLRFSRHVYLIMVGYSKMVEGGWYEEN